MSVSAPYLDPYSQRRTSDWLVVAREGDFVDVHRFTSRDDADAWLDDRLADPEQERELDERRIEAASS